MIFYFYFWVRSLMLKRVYISGALAWTVVSTARFRQKFIPEKCEDPALPGRVASRSMLVIFFFLAYNFIPPFFNFFFLSLELTRSSFFPSFSYWFYNFYYQFQLLFIIFVLFNIYGKLMIHATLFYYRLLKIVHSRWYHGTMPGFSYILWEHRIVNSRKLCSN